MNKNTKIIRYTAAILTATVIAGCEMFSDCGECFSPPGAFALRILNEYDSSDAFFSGRFHPDSVEIYYCIQEMKVSVYGFVNMDSSAGVSMIFSNEIPWKSLEGFKSFYLQLSSGTTDTLYLDIVPETQNCCTHHPVRCVKVNGEEPEQDPGGRYFYYR